MGRGVTNPSQKVIETKFTPAAHWLISRDTLLKVGLFSPVFYHYGEDNNYLHRVKYFGFKNGVCTDANAVHDKTGRKRSREQHVYMVQNSVLKYSADINVPFPFALTFALFALVRDSIKLARKQGDITIIADCLSKGYDFAAIYRDRRKNMKYVANK